VLKLTNRIQGTVPAICLGNEKIVKNHS